MELLEDRRVLASLFSSDPETLGFGASEEPVWAAYDEADLANHGTPAGVDGSDSLLVSNGSLPIAAAVMPTDPNEVEITEYCQAKSASGNSFEKN
jgi:hypothetical protein